MPLTTNITTADGVEHPAAYGLCYPLSIANLDTEVRVEVQVHCWHSEAARNAGAAELSGFPASISWSGTDAGMLLVGAMSGLGAITWGADDLTKAAQAQAHIVDAMEQAVVLRDTRFTQA